MKHKYFFYIIIIILISFITNIYVLAHSGRTDANGGHNDNINGGYHYHHGYPAHDHPNGKCPYDFEDTTFEEEKKTDPKDNKRNIIWYVYSIFCALICSFIIYFLLSSVINILLSFFIDTDKYSLAITVISITIIYLTILFLILSE